jgi:predicted transcriptional regulator
MVLVPPRPRRTQVDIIIKILAVASKGATKTALVYKSNLNFTLVQKYVDLLQRKGLLDIVQTHVGYTAYKTTTAGAEALKALRSAMNFVLEDELTALTE